MTDRHHTNTTPVAITGYACRLPGAPDVDAFWTLLDQGRHAIRLVGPDRWSSNRFLNPNPAAPGFAYTAAAGLLDDIWGFDAAFFDISPREAEQMDPQQRLLLEVTWEALEAAGLGTAPGTRTGVFIGGSSTDHAVRFVGDPSAVGAQFMTGNTLSILANRISYVFDFKGPSYTVDTACSSSFFALHEGVRSLTRGDIDTAVVGGVNAILSPYSYVGFSRAAMLSPSGLCRAFDKAADGYVRSEGAVVFVLRRLESALADEDPVRGVILGTAINTDGRTVGVSMPSATDQATLLRRLYRDAEIDRADLAFVEAHGTGTPIGDPIEAAAIGAALGSERRDAPLPLGSVKSNIGHLEPASGLAGLLKAQLALEHGRFPRTLHVEVPNPSIDFPEAGLSLATEPVDLPLRLDDRPWIAGVNSFGFGGANAHVALRQPLSDETAASTRQAEKLPPLVISARSRKSLQVLAERWRARLAEAPPEDATSLIGTAAHRAAWLDHRLVVTAGSASEMAERLGAFADGTQCEGCTSGVTPADSRNAPSAFLFAGNGSQWPGMGRDLYLTDDGFRSTFDDIAAAFSAHGVPDLVELTLEPSLAELSDGSVAQALLFAVQAALVESLSVRGLRPDVVSGHSVGEVTAAWAAGMLDLHTAVKIIVARSRATQALRGSGGMAAVLTDARRMIELISREGSGRTSLAADNSPRSVTVSGNHDELKRLLARLREERIAARPLDIEYPYHSPALDQVQDELMAALADCRAEQAASARMASSTAGGIVVPSDLTPDFWWRNARETVRFREALGALADLGCRSFVEISPRPVLQTYVNDTMRALGFASATVPTLLGPNSAPITADSMVAQALAHGAEPRRTLFFGARPPTARRMPAYPWDRRRHKVARTPEALDLLGEGGSDHPLLGWRVRPGEGTWRSVIDTSRLPFLKDHALDGTPVLPATGFVEIALAAGAEELGATALEVRDFDILSPLPLEDGTATALRTTLERESGILRIEARPYLSDSDWSLHARGTVRKAAVSDRRDDPQPVALGAVAVDRLYDTLAACGLDYGPQFRLLAQLRTSGSFAQATLQPGTHDLRFIVDPARFDAALHALMPLLAEAGTPEPSPSTDVYLPVRVDRLVCLGHDAPAAQATVTLNELDAAGARAAVALFDAEGAPLVRVDGLQLRRLEKRRQRLDSHLWVEQQVPVSAADNPGDTTDIFAGVDRRLSEARITFKTVPEPDATGLLIDAIARRITWETLRGIGSGDATPARDGVRPNPGAIPLFSRLVAAMAEDGLVEPGADDSSSNDDPRAVILSTECPYPPLSHSIEALIAEAPDSAAVMMGLLSARSAVDDALRNGLSTEPPPATRGGSGSRRRLWSALTDAFENILSAADDAPAPAVLLVGDAPVPVVERVRAATEGRLVLSDPAEAVANAVKLRLPSAMAPLALRWSEAIAAGPFDLVLTGDALTRLAAADPEPLRDCLRPGGLLMAAEPLPSLADDLFNGIHAAWWAESIDPALPLPLRRTGPEWAALLSGVGFVDIGHAWLTSTSGPTTVVTGRRASATDARPSPSRPDRALVVASETLRGRWLGEQREKTLAQLAQARLPMVDPDPADAGFAGARELVCVCTGLSPAEAKCLISTLQDALAREDGPSRLWLVVGNQDERSVETALLRGLFRVLVNEFPATGLRFLALDGSPTPELVIEAVDRAERFAGEEPELLLRKSGATAPRVRSAETMPDRIADARHGTEAARVLALGREGRLDSLHWAPALRRSPAPGEVEIEVAATGLNFRDVMWAQRLLPAEALKQGFAGPSLGMECAGVVARVGEGASFREGDRVVAFAPHAFASHVTVSDQVVARLPEETGFDAAAALPTIFLTAQYGLVELAKLEPGETVLIHGAAGGVGMAALQIARARGARVFATAGRPEKRDLLRLLGADLVLDSRSLTFASEIEAETAGEGVDVVLNSLAGEAMERSLECLKPFGRFVELGKQDFYANSRIGLRPFRQNLSYFGVDADQLVSLRPRLARRLFAGIAHDLATGRIVPPPIQVFEGSEVVEAFRLMQRSDHIGKIVVRPTRPEVRAARPLPLGEGSWLIVGGLGGFGLATARWLAGKGVHKLWLTSRSGTPKPGGEKILSDLRARGVRVEAVAVDASDREGMEMLIARIAADGSPLEGIVHAATVLDDARFADLTPARIEAVIRPKVEGARLLDQLTRRLSPQHFVLFSSVAALFGNPGQAAYAAANAGLEAIARQRRTRGLPALAVAWGPISDHGLLARDDDARERLTRALGRLMTAEEALAMLGDLISTDLPPAAVTVAPMQWGRLSDDLRILSQPVFSEVDRTPGRKGGDASDLLAALEALPDDEAEALLLDRLRAETARILRQSEGEIDPYRPLVELGFDSLMAVDLKMAAEDELGLALPLTALGERVTLANLAQKAIARLRNPNDVVAGERAGDVAEALAARHLAHDGTEIDPATADRILSRAGEGGAAR